MPSDILDVLRTCADDPMWADHAEISKAALWRAANEIEKLRHALGDIQNYPHKTDMIELWCEEALGSPRKFEVSTPPRIEYPDAGS